MRDDLAEPDISSGKILVGQDRAGHWLVQESSGTLEGRFVSREAAISFARAERHRVANGEIVIATFPLTPVVSFDPVRPDERAYAHAA